MRRSLRRARRSRSSRAERARGATPCVQPPMGWLYLCNPTIVEPCHAWLPFDQALRAATHGVALRVQSDHRRATPCVAAVRSGTACSHPWGGSTWTGCRSHPWGGSTRAIRHVEPRHAWLPFDQALRAATHGVALRGRVASATHGVALRVQSDHRRATPCVAAVRSGIACTHTTAATRQPKTNRPFIIAKWPGNEQKNV